MLDLDAPVQLEEEEVAAVEHELGRAGAPVADRARERDRRLAHRRAQLRVERGRGRLLEHLLVAALDRALALAERDRAAPAVAEQLDLDVPRPLEVALAEDGVVAERGLRLAPGGLERLVELGRRADDAHPAPAAARRRLHEQREAELVRVALVEHRHARLAGGPLRGELVAAGAQRLRRRADEDEPGRLDRLREVGVLGEEAVAGVDRVGAGRPARRGCAPRSGGRTRSRPSRRRRARAARRRRRARRPRRSRSRARGRCGRCGPRSRRGSLRGASGCPSRAALLEEGAQPLLALVARPPLGGAGEQVLLVARLEHEPLRLADGGRAAGEDVRRRRARPPRRDRRRPRRRGRSGAPSPRRSARR